ncbi:MAG: S8 family serine peptidase [Firmicutes bacterium]|nr:S8 family serine peptidase [Bacillota bacterium]
MKKIFFLLIFSAVLLFGGSAAAEGYLFTVKDEIVVPYSLESTVKRVPLSSQIMYEADSIDEIYDITDGENLIDIIYNCEVKLFSSPDDTYYSYQWYTSDINSYSAYEKGLRGDGVKIGIIDSGINYGHEDIDTSKIVSMYNVIDDSDDVTDTMGHGSFVTGLIAADINNGTGIAGIADNAEIAVYKIFEDSSTELKYLLTALDMAIEDGCDVINMSLGISEDGINDSSIEALEELIDAAAERNIIIVAAAGNDGDNTMNYPAAFDSVIGVGSVSQSLKHSSFSNKNSSVFVAAPGEYMASAWYGGSDSYNLAKSYSSSSGTSFSTPIVTAMAALAKQVYGDITIDDVKELLQDTSQDLGMKGYDVSYGWGLVDIDAFTDELIENYLTDISLSDDGETVTARNLHSEAAMYTAGYSDGLLTSITIDEITDSSAEIEVSVPEDCDSVRLFFWSGVTPVWDAIDLDV